MTIDKDNAQHIIADDGKVFKRIEDGQLYGKEIYLGYSYYIGGVKLDEPHLDVVEDFEEVEDETPEEEIEQAVEE
jgi:hypothetical protein